MKKVFFGLIFFYILCLSTHAVSFPEKLSDNAKISILSVNYNDIAHSLFSKSCLRIYDKSTGFDQIVDFAHFDNFDDQFFILKFFLKNKKARITTEPFLEYFLDYSKKTNVSCTESLLQLNSKEIAYIYSFLKTLHTALPYYEYDFDIITNNSETHISQILHDCFRMIGNKETNESSFFTDITKHNLRYKKINDSYILTLEKEKLNFSEQDFSQIFHDEQIKLVIILGIFSGFIFLITIYQTLVYFFEKLYILSIYKSVQTFDFSILFASGLMGLIIILLDLFSNQAMLRNNFQFLFLFPLNLIAAFLVLKQFISRKLQIIYWSVTSGLSVLYITVLSILEKQLPIVTLLLILPLFFRTLYFDFLAIDIKSIKKAPAQTAGA